VPQDHEEGRLQVCGGVLEAPQGLRGHDVAGDAHDEEIPEPLVEQELRRNSGVAAPEDRGERPLARGQLARVARPGSSRSRSLATNRPLPATRRHRAVEPAGGARRPRGGGRFVDRGMPYCTASIRPRPLGSPSHLG
jgi:hypothetical protein